MCEITHKMNMERIIVGVYSRLSNESNSFAVFV